MLQQIFHILAFLCFFAPIWGQNNDQTLARNRYEAGEYKKALFYYKRLVKNHPRQINYLKELVQCYQQLEDFQSAANTLKPHLENNQYHPELFILMGVNYTLQKDTIAAKKQYESVFPYIDKNPSFAYVIGTHFKQYSLLDYAIRTYEKAAALSPKLDFSMYLAGLYGEQGKQDKMIRYLLQSIAQNPTRKYNALRVLRGYINDDAENTANQLLKKQLLLKLQKTPDVIWNELLSWLFMQQKQYRSAFIQERSIFKRKPQAQLHRIISLGNTCEEQKDYNTAQLVYRFIIENSEVEKEQLQAHIALLQIEQQTQDEAKLAALEKEYNNLITQYGRSRKTINLQIAYGKFVAFELDQPENAIAFLKESLQLPLNRFQQAQLKLALADVLVYHEKFNHALIYYSQIQKSLKNHVLSQEARYKVAQTSFYKGDFEWALSQLKVLRNSTTQLIANDAMELSLLISDNTQKDSLHVALKKYAKADYLYYQKKYTRVIHLLDDILEQHKGEEIEDEALFKQATVFEELGSYEKARLNYGKILTFYPESILVDNSLFALAKLYEVHLDDPKKAKEYYEKVLFNHQDSIYFLEARKRFRQLRGDTIY